MTNLALWEFNNGKWHKLAYGFSADARYMWREARRRKRMYPGKRHQITRGARVVYEDAENADQATV